MRVRPKQLKRVRRLMDGPDLRAYWKMGRFVCDVVGERAAYGASALELLSKRLGGAMSAETLRRTRLFRLMWTEQDLRRAETAGVPWYHVLSLLELDALGARLGGKAEVALRRRRRAIVRRYPGMARKPIEFDRVVARVKARYQPTVQGHGKKVSDGRRFVTTRLREVAQRLRSDARLGRTADRSEWQRLAQDLERMRSEAVALYGAARERPD